MFLGPTQDGVSPETGLLTDWPAEGPPLAWALQIGTGYSAPAVRGNRLVVHHREGDEEIVECLRADTGDTLWTYAYPSQFRDPYGYNNGPRCSPVLTADHCYTFGAEGLLACLQLTTGAEVWVRNVRQDFTIPDGFFGVGATPVLEGDLLIVLVGGQPNSGVVAFDALTGKTRWEAVGERTWNGAAMNFPTRRRSSSSQSPADTGPAEESPADDPGTRGEAYAWTGEEMVVSYSSPRVATIHGRRHLLCLMRQGLVSLDPQTGQEHFHFWFMSRTYESVNAASPVVVDDTILLSAAYNVGSVLLRVAEDGQAVSEVWRDTENLLAHWSTPLYHEGHFYGFSGRHEQEGELRCIRREDGQVVWQTNGWDRPLQDLTRNDQDEIVDVQSGQTIPWPFYGRGSAILVDGRLLVLAERGTLALVNADPGRWTEVARCTAPQLQYPSWPAPVLSRGRLYLRDEDSLICLDLMPSQP
jgi:outer membrane protein assembly factor BamB